MTVVTVVRGTVDIPDSNFLAEQRRLNLLSNGHAARTGQHIRRCWPGDTITTDEISAAELARLVALGALRPVKPTP
jgi:hypothetical protein